MLYTKPVFAPDSEEAVFALIDQLPLGTLITIHDGVPQCRIRSSSVTERGVG